MTFDELTYEIDGNRENHELNPIISRIVTDSRKVEPGDLFVAVIGLSSDGHEFVGDALGNGAVGFVLDERRDLPHSLRKLLRNSPTLTCKSSMEVLGQLASRFYDYPFQSIKSIAITGTNGKSTTAALLESIFQQAGRSCGVIGTIFFRLGEWEIHSPYTTPESNDLMELVRGFCERGAEYVVLEASSHGLSLHRVDEARFDVGVFTNLSHDHLDFHANVESYFQAKRRLFSVLLPASRRIGKPGQPVINADDPHGERLLEENKELAISFGISSKAHVRAESIVAGPLGSRFDLILPQLEGGIPTKLPLVGRHNIYNALAAAGAAHALEMNPQQIVDGLSRMEPVPGRLELVHRDDHTGPRVYVDYAHTPDALRHALSALRELEPVRLYVLFGCGGDRDTSKRAEMGRVAVTLADLVIVTSDNPRTEDPKAIIDDIIAGVTSESKTGGSLTRNEEAGCFAEVDRQKAIEITLRAATTDSLVLIAGKGHETTQDIGGVRIPFDDRQIAKSALAQWSERPN